MRLGVTQSNVHNARVLLRHAVNLEHVASVSAAVATVRSATQQTHRGGALPLLQRRDEGIGGARTIACGERFQVVAATRAAGGGRRRC